MNYIKDVQLKTNSNSYNVIVEIPKGTNSKYELVDGKFNEVLEVRKVKGKYPFYYGCFPQTYAGDKDPLDMILLSNKKRRVLDIVEVTVIGAIKTIDNGEIDDKIIVVANDEKALKSIKKLEKKTLKFLKTYKGKKSNTQIDLGIKDCDEALAIIDQANRDYIIRNNRKNNKQNSIVSF